MQQSKTRKIIHIDMDCFFVAIEMRDNPSLQDKAVAVGGSPEKRGVISTANYIAREYGARSALSSAKAMKLCPSLIIVPPCFDKYKEASKIIREVFAEYTDIIEPVSLDEAYLDVSNCKQYRGSATLIANDIRYKIFKRTKLTASAGVGPNKLIAKIASDINKPNGICTVPPDEVQDFIKDLDVSKINGVGKVTRDKLKKLNVNTFSDLQKILPHQLEESFGKFGKALALNAFGNDNRQVTPYRERKSISIERTFNQDIKTYNELQNKALKIISDLEPKLKDISIKSLFIKIKYSNFKQITRSITINTLEITHILDILKKVDLSNSVRLLGIGAQINNKNKTNQMDLMDRI